MRIISSPLRRALETAEPFARLWGSTITVEPAIAELPPPQDVTAENAVQWFLQLAHRDWRDLPRDYEERRTQIIRFADSITETALVVTHLLAINAMVGFAQQTERVISYAAANCSVTAVEIGDSWRLVRRGRESRALRQALSQ